MEKEEIPQYINDWITIVEQMHNDNTYKLAWGRAIIECVILNKYEDVNGDSIRIQFLDISRCMLKYYWNQIFYFNLRQGPKGDKSPVFIQLVNDLIDKYKSICGTSIPEWYTFAEKTLEKDEAYFYKTLKSMSNVLTQNVAFRFKNVTNGKLEIYEYEEKQKEQSIILKRDNAELLKNYSRLLIPLLNYKWAQLLEKFNLAPRICSKVTGASNSEIRRESLKKYKDYLINEMNGQPKDFYTGLPLEYKDISVDHVIPWSFMYSDDIWNLVLTSKSNNSSKSNSKPSEFTIERLKRRNFELVNKTTNEKMKKVLQEAINNSYIDKFFGEMY